jgi:DNA-binding IclR family transcriptional regulator
MTEYPVQATRTTFRVIEVLRDSGGAGVTGVARELDLSKSAVHNHLVTLERMEFVRKEAGKYRLGLRFLDLGTAIREESRPYALAQPVVDTLAAQTGEFASLVLPEFGAAVYAHTRRPREESPIRLGSRVPLHASASGKAVLARRPSGVLDEYVETRGLPGLTDRTITDADELGQELRTVSDRGLAFDRGERVRGRRAVAAPICDGNNRSIAAVSVTGPAERLSGKRLEEELPGLVLSSAKTIELELSS